MSYPLYKDMALALDIPEHNLRRGDVVRVIDHHVAPGGREGYSIEVFSATGETVAVTTVDEPALESLQSDEVLAIRRRSSAAA